MDYKEQDMDQIDGVELPPTYNTNDFQFQRDNNPEKLEYFSNISNPDQRKQSHSKFNSPYQNEGNQYSILYFRIARNESLQREQQLKQGRKAIINDRENINYSSNVSQAISGPFVLQTKSQTKHNLNSSTQSKRIPPKQLFSNIDTINRANYNTQPNNVLKGAQQNGRSDSSQNYFSNNTSLNSTGNLNSNSGKVNYNNKRSPNRNNSQMSSTANSQNPFQYRVNIKDVPSPRTSIGAGTNASHLNHSGNGNFIDEIQVEETETTKSNRLLMATLQSEQERVLELQESLRNEMLVNEEQRSYIEILKGALQSKIDGSEISQLINETARQAKVNKVDFFSQFNNLQTFLERQMQEGPENQNKMKELINAVMQLHEENEFFKNKNEEIIQLNENLNNELMKTFENSKNINNEVSILLQEKEKLIVFVNELQSNIQTLEQTNNSIQSEFNKEIQAQLATENRFQDLEESYRQLETAYNQSIQELQLTQREKEEKLNENQQKMKNQEIELQEFEYFQNQTKILQEKVAQYQQNLQTLQQRLQAEKEEKESVSDSIKAVEKDANQFQSENEKLREKLKQTENEIQTLQEKDKNNKKSLENLHQKLEAEHRASKEKQSSLMKISSFEEQLANTQLELTQANEIVEDFRKRLEAQRENHSSEVKSVFDNLSSIRSDNRVLKQENNRLSLENQGLEEQVRNMKDMLSQKQELLHTANEELIEMRKVAGDRLVDINSLNKKSTQLETETANLQKAVIQNQNRTNQLEVEKDNLLKELQIIENIKNELKVSNEQLVKQIQQFTQNYENQQIELNQKCQSLQQLSQPLISMISQSREHIVEKQVYSQRLYDYTIEEYLNELKMNLDEIIREKEQIQSLSDEKVHFFEQNTEKIKTYEIIVEQFRKAEHESKEKMEQCQSENKRLQQDIQEINNQYITLQQRMENLLVERGQFAVDIEKWKEENMSLKQDLQNYHNQNLKLTQELEQAEESKKIIYELSKNLDLINSEKYMAENIIELLKKFIFNSEVISLICQYCDILTGINSQEEEQAAANNQIKLSQEQINYRSQSDSGKQFESSIRRKMEECRNRILDSEKQLNILYSRQSSIESEISKIQALERQRYDNISVIEQLNMHVTISKSQKSLKIEIVFLSQKLQSEVDRLRAQYEMAEHSQKSYEEAYENILENYKSINMSRGENDEAQRERLNRSPLTHHLLKRNDNSNQSPDESDIDKDYPQIDPNSAHQYKSDDQKQLINQFLYSQKEQLPSTKAIIERNYPQNYRNVYKQNSNEN